MSQIGLVIAEIFDPTVNYTRFVADTEEMLGSDARMFDEREFNELRSLARASSASHGSLILQSTSPRFHISTARNALAEMRAAHDRLFNVLDAFLVLADNKSMVQFQLESLRNPDILNKAATQGDLVGKVKAARARQRQNLANALKAAEQLSNKYIRDPWRVPAQNKAEQAYYDAQAEMVRYNDLLNQVEGLNIADLYDDSALVSLRAEAMRTWIELESTNRSFQNLQDRQQLLAFDFTTRITEALKDVFQNALQIVGIATRLWGMDALERLAPDHSLPGKRHGWYFALGESFWPPWFATDMESTASFLLGDGVLFYLDTAEAVVDAMESRLRDFDGNAVRSLMSFKLAFAKTADGTSRATVKVPRHYSYQEVGAIYLKGMPEGVPHVEAIRKEVRVNVDRAANGRYQATAQIQNPERGNLFFGSDCGLGGESPIFAIENEALIAAHSANQPLELVCRSDQQPNFEVDCILRLSGYNNTR